MLLGFLASALIFAGRARADDLGFSLSDVSLENPGEIVITVVDAASGKTLPDAAISLADSLEDSLHHPLFQSKSDAQGEWHLKSVHVPQVVTISKQGYETLSLVGVGSRTIHVSLKPITSLFSVIASGTMTGWGGSQDSSMIHGGLVLRTLSATDLLHFDVQSIISPLSDTIDIFGDRRVPSNLVLPTQDVFVLFGSVHLDKPQYRLPLFSNQQAHIVGVQGQMSSGDVFSVLQNGGKLSVSLLNKISFLSFGMSDLLTPHQDFSQDINTEIPLASGASVLPNAAPFQGNIVVASVMDLDGTKQTLVPTDVKASVDADNPSDPQPVTLAFPQSSMGEFVSALGGMQDIVTVAISPHGEKSTGIVSQVPASVDSGTPLSPGDFLNADDVADTGTVRAPQTGLGAVVFETAQTGSVWAVYVLPRAGDAQVPVQELMSSCGADSYSTLHFDFGDSFNGARIDGSHLMRNLKRFSRAKESLPAPQQ